MFKTKVDVTLSIECRCHLLNQRFDVTLSNKRLRTSAVSQTQSSPCSGQSLETSTSMRSNRQEMTNNHNLDIRVTILPGKFFHLFLYLCPHPRIYISGKSRSRSHLFPLLRLLCLLRPPQHVPCHHQRHLQRGQRRHQHHHL